MNRFVVGVLVTAILALTAAPLTASADQSVDPAVAYALAERLTHSDEDVTVRLESGHSILADDTEIGPDKARADVLSTAPTQLHLPVGHGELKGKDIRPRRNTRAQRERAHDRRDAQHRKRTRSPSAPPSPQGEPLAP